MKTILLLSLMAAIPIGCTFHKQDATEPNQLALVVSRYNALVEADTMGEIIRTASAHVDEADRASFLADATQARRMIHTGLTSLVRIANASQLAEEEAWFAATQQVTAAVNDLLALAQALDAIDLSEKDLATIRIASQTLSALLLTLPDTVTAVVGETIPLPKAPNLPARPAVPLSSHIIGVLK